MKKNNKILRVKYYEKIVISNFLIFFGLLFFLEFFVRFIVLAVVVRTSKNLFDYDKKLNFIN